MNYKIYNENCLVQLDQMKENCIDSIVTDPPYELNFMGKGWDNAGVSFNKETWQKCLRVLKPGGYLLAFGGSRTFHRIAVAIEDAGFEIRDTIMWLYGSGFPKSMNIGLAIDKKNGVESKVIGKQTVPDIRGDAYGTMNDKQGGSYKNIVRDIKKATNEWSGWGTALKPSFEPIVVARKPFKGSLVDNVIEWGVGGLNIDECRIELNGDKKQTGGCKTSQENISHMAWKKNGSTKEDNSIGRFPANTILTYDQITFDEVCGGFPETKSNGGKSTMPKMNSKSDGINIYNFGKKNAERIESEYIAPADSGSASRYFYCAKASKKDRDEGLDTLRNIHPTVKPTELMQYLVRLVTPNGGTILDPFMGSGSTGKAVAYENQERNKDYKFIGIELNKEYCEIAKARINYAGGKNEEETI